MRKLFRFLFRVLGVIAILAALVAAYIWFFGRPTCEKTLPTQLANLQAPRDTAHLIRGQNIAEMMCKHCHMNDAGTNLSGKNIVDLPKQFGTISSYNITNDPTIGIGKWSDGELYWFLRTGKRKSGIVNSIMPTMPHASEDDILSIITWLRSDDPTLQAATDEVKPNDWNFFMRFLGIVALKPLELPAKPIAAPDTTNTVAWGKYLADDLISCYACHSADFSTNNISEPSKSGGYYAGGNQMPNLVGEIVSTANITPDPETGIGNWTKEQFRNATKNMIKPDGTPLVYPMVPHSALSDSEIDAIYAYLKTIPPVKNAVKRYKHG